MQTKKYSIDLTGPDRSIRFGHLKLGGTSSTGRSIEVTNAYLALDGRPFFAVSGEFQFSRFPQAYWEEEILKMKASGVNVIATYLFWIHHEDQKGQFTWQGQNNARQFVQLCEKHGLWVIARIGPFCHGECRNGGLPDWMYGQPFEVRSNDPEYLQFVARYFEEIGRQLQGKFFKDGGPIIGLQLENEYGHTGAPWDTADRSQAVEWMTRSGGDVDHLIRLRSLARDAGLDAPLLTFTAWGSPIIENESLPVHGGYAYPVWVDQPGPSDLYRFTDLTENPPDKNSVLYTATGHYPSVMAEMQGGIQVRYNNRPEVPPRAIEAFTLVTAGSGCNFIGYYIYHGGSNPIGSRGYANEILHPQVSYDFQAPIGEFGEIRPSCRSAKLLLYFFQAFGEQLAPMGVHLPAGAEKIDPEDPDTLRWAVRSHGGSGFIFLNNFQDHLQSRPHKDFALELTFPNHTLQIPLTGSLTLPEDACCIFPFNLDLDGAHLEYTTAQPLTVLHSDTESHYFFFSHPGITPHFVFKAPTLTHLTGDFTAVRRADRTVVEVQPEAASSFSFETRTGKTVRITTLPREEAEHAWLGEAWGERRLVVSSADPIFSQGGIELRSTGQSEVTVLIFPPLSDPINTPGIRSDQNNIDCYTKLTLNIEPNNAHVNIIPRENGKFHLAFMPDAFVGVNDLFLKIDYSADTGAAFIDGELVADNYNNGTPWIIGLKRFLPAVLTKGLTLKFRPLRKGIVKNTSSAMAARLAFEGEEILRLDAIELIPEYTFQLHPSSKSS